MNISNNSSTTFQGGFRLKNVTPEVKAQLPNIAKRGKQIFYDFENKGDVFVVLRDNLDKRMLRFIQDEKPIFEYYKDVNTNCKLDSQMPELLSEMLATIKDAPIRTIAQLRKIVREHKKIETIELKGTSYTDNILKALCIDNKHSIDSKKGAKIVNDYEFNRKIFISPPTKKGVHYVIVQPESISKSSERYAINSDGKILQKYMTPDEIREFVVKFNAQLIKNI